MPFEVDSLLSNVRGGCPAPPPLYSFVPSQCISQSGCKKAHCECGSTAQTIVKCTGNMQACFDATLAACSAAGDSCHSFAIQSDCSTTGKMGIYYPYGSGGSKSATVPNTDWQAYVRSGTGPLPPPTPSPPTPAPSPQCVRGPSECPPAPPGSIFPPPGSRPPGCNHKGCTTLPTLLPKWKATYMMNESTLIMPCNNTGPTDPSTTLGWKYLDFDWSNWKGTGDADGWAKHKPMDCEELMVKQVQLTVAASPHQQAFVYRNMVKALPWFTSVREKISDPKYAKWFVRFSDAVVANHSLGHVPVCDKTLTTVCSDLYHDQSQTPGYPHGDGNCAAPGCDVGGVVPVGEYIFDHRNANVTVDGLTFIDWFITSYFGGPAGLGNDHIIGFYIDDDWGNMNPNGPSEMEGHAMEDMGLDTNDLKDMVTAYNWVTTQVYNAIVSKGKYAWNLFLNNDPNCINCGDCPQPWVKKESCAADLRAYGVNATSPFVNRALLYGFYPGSCRGVDPANLTEVDEDVANFLLVRGDYAYLGNGWTGCSRTYEFPTQRLTADYGTPLARATEVGGHGSGVFQREWTKATIEMDCNTYTPTITMK